MSKLFSIFAIFVSFLVVTPTISAKNAPLAGVTHRPRKALYFGMTTSTAECVVGIVLSKNPATAAEIGVPILVVGNIVATKLYEKHPKWSGLIQNLSGLGCLAGALTRHAAKIPIKTVAPTTTTPPSTPPMTPDPPTTPPVPPGQPLPLGPPVTPPVTPTPPPAPPVTPPAPPVVPPVTLPTLPVPPVTPPVHPITPPGPPVVPPPPPPVHIPHCIQDCGFPGNGGINGGGDTGKPPFPGVGRP